MRFCTVLKSPVVLEHSRVVDIALIPRGLYSSLHRAILTGSHMMGSNGEGDRVYTEKREIMILKCP